MAAKKSNRHLSAVQRRLLMVLGVPTLSMAFSTTAVSTYLPVLARRFTSSTVVVGVILVGEGLMALVVPLLAGSWSDRLRARGGSRLTFLIAGAPIAAAALAALGLVRLLPAMGLLVALFFAANFFSYEPYRALYPDLLPNKIAARGQSTQAVWRGIGTILALAGGGVLLSVWAGLPFITAAALQLGGAAVLVSLLPRVSDQANGRHLRPRRADLRRGTAEAMGTAWRLLMERRELRLFLVANLLWELSLGALKTFIVLYVTKGLGRSLAVSSLIIAVVAVVILGGAIASGKLGDRFGKARVMQWAACLYGVALAIPIFTRATAVLVASAPVIAFGGGLTMTLPYAILMPLMPSAHHGMLTGFYSLSRGLGVMLGPLLAGLAIQLLSGQFTSTHGFGAMWIVTSAAVLASIPVLIRLRRCDAEKPRRRRTSSAPRARGRARRPTTRRA